MQDFSLGRHYPPLCLLQLRVSPVAVILRLRNSSEMYNLSLSMLKFHLPPWL